jgi:hypothetical protein
MVSERMAAAGVCIRGWREGTDGHPLLTHLTKDM